MHEELVDGKMKIVYCGCDEPWDFGLKGYKMIPGHRVCPNCGLYPWTHKEEKKKELPLDFI